MEVIISFLNVALHMSIDSFRLESIYAYKGWGTKKLVEVAGPAGIN
jgi:hypothetical protein